MPIVVVNPHCSRDRPNSEPVQRGLTRYLHEACRVEMSVSVRRPYLTEVQAIAYWLGQTIF